MILIAKRNMVLRGKTYREGDVVDCLNGVQTERYVRDGLVVYRESPVEFSDKVEVLSEIENLDPEKKPSKRKE